MTEVTGIDHIYIAVHDLAQSEAFYDRVMLGALAESVRFFVCEPVALNRSFAADHEPLFEL